MGLRRVAELADVPPGTMMSVEVDGTEVALCNAAGTIYAMGNVCPHAGGPIAEGALHGFTAVCPWHGWEFDCRTGRMEWNANVAVPTYVVQVVDGTVFLDVEARTDARVA